MNAKIREEFSGKGLLVKFDEPLSKHTTYRTGGPAAVFVDARTTEDLRNALEIAKYNDFPFYLLGAGSNTLFSDAGFDGAVIRLKDTFGEIAFTGLGNTFSVRAGAGVALPLLLKKCADSGASGLEALAGIPGTVGGGLVMNAGTRGGCISDKLSKVVIMNPKRSVVTLSKNEVSFAYRHSSLDGQVILSAEFALDKAPANEIVKRITDNLVQRLETQPLGSMNAGSVFKNPAGGKPAWQLIDECGLKGYRAGNVQVSEKHANFIINTGSAKSGDILKVIEHVRRKVKEKSGIELELEIKIAGENR
ncbi:MAG: UDP-N-acetylenolpyruvoylglucosamine reductase [Elusimicrobia bacterium RIFOXYB2_FULL_48_7]|nr:MAG: UDP-N-acetylenolpyruvoylglucosamine reductase [Elusimicrobia bacterium RIFOXYB2_FULL_48_7]